MQQQTKAKETEQQEWNEKADYCTDRKQHPSLSYSMGDYVPPTKNHVRSPGPHRPCINHAPHLWPLWGPTHRPSELRRRLGWENVPSKPHLRRAQSHYQVVQTQGAAATGTRHPLHAWACGPVAPQIPAPGAPPAAAHRRSAALRLLDRGALHT